MHILYMCTNPRGDGGLGDDFEPYSGTNIIFIDCKGKVEWGLGCEVVAQVHLYDT